MDLLGIVLAGEKSLQPRIDRALHASGLALGSDEVRDLQLQRVAQTAELERVDFGGGALATIAEEFATSPFLDQDELATQLSTIQRAFYQLRDEIPAEVTDEEIARALREAFDGDCAGDPEALLSLAPREVAPTPATEYRICDDEGRTYVHATDEWADGPC